MQIWDVGANFGARKAFAGKLKAAGRELREKAKESGGIIGVASDNEESDDDDD